MTQLIAPNSRRLKELRIRWGLSAARLASAAGVSERQIWRLEAGDRPNVSAVLLARITLVLGTSLEYVLGLTDDPRSVHELVASAPAEISLGESARNNSGTVQPFLPDLNPEEERR
jgi:transcriptional regulator with XRE-family HTH domain